MLNLTLEQKSIVYADNEFIYVSARAGTGKTTTLSEFVNARKKDTFLYIVYNSSIKEEAIEKFRASVVINTIHGLAYKEIGFKYKEKLTGNLKTEDIFKGLSYFDDKKIENEEDFKIAYAVSAIIGRFCNTSIKSFDEIEHEDRIISLAKEYWLQMIDFKNSSVKMTHDGYLKLYHLEQPILDYDYIMIDEAQDSNELMLDIVYAQKSKKIFVGDEHQRIYSFRGALNVFEESNYFNPESDHCFLSLTESFRFGEEIANVANLLLSKYKNETNLLVGTDLRDSKVEFIDKDLQYTIITRTNAHLFDLAVDFVRKGKKIHINGGPDFIFNQILDGYYLYKGQKEKIRNEYLKTFSNYAQLKGFTNNVKIPEYVLLVKTIDKYKDSLKGCIDLIERNSVGSKRADVILTTAHKSKGLEYVSVLIADDFMPLYDENGFELPTERIDLEEINLLYVAVTRATHDLELNKQLDALMWNNQNN